MKHCGNFDPHDPHDDCFGTRPWRKKPAPTKEEREAFKRKMALELKERGYSNQEISRVLGR